VFTFFLRLEEQGQYGEESECIVLVRSHTDTGDRLRLVAKAKGANQVFWDRRSTLGSLSTGDTGRILESRYHISGRGSADTGVVDLWLERTTFLALLRWVRE
jgi:hypothetical protein